MQNLLPDPFLFFMFIGFVCVGVAVYFADVYRQLIVKDRRIIAMANLVDALMKEYEKNIALLLSVLLNKLTQDPVVLATLEAQKEELSRPEQARVWKFQRMRAVSRRLFDILEAHPDLKDADILNTKKSIYDTEDDISLAAQNHDAYVEAFNLRLRQMPDKWFAVKFHISPHPALWSENLKKNPN